MVKLVLRHSHRLDTDVHCCMTKSQIIGIVKQSSEYLPSLTNLGSYI